MVVPRLLNVGRQVRTSARNFFGNVKQVAKGVAFALDFIKPLTDDVRRRDEREWVQLRTSRHRFLRRVK
jgi:hypothetical protein